jgi:hypothetical protein
VNSLSGISYGAQLSSAAARYHLDPTLLAAVAAQETGGPGQNSGRNIVGDGGHGHGLMQIDDRYHAFASTPAAMDPQANADYAAGLLSNLLQQYGGNVKAALSAYNAGSPTATGTVTDWGNGQTLGYADSVLQHYSAIAQSEGTGLATQALPAGGFATLLGDAATPSVTPAATGASATSATAASGASTSSDASVEMAQLESIMQGSMPAQSSTSPNATWVSLNGASSQVTTQADLLSASLGDTADDSSTSDQS